MRFGRKAGGRYHGCPCRRHERVGSTFKFSGKETARMREGTQAAATVNALPVGRAAKRLFIKIFAFSKAGYGWMVKRPTTTMAV